MRNAITTNRMGTDEKFAKLINEEVAIGLMQKLCKTATFDQAVSFSDTLWTGQALCRFVSPALLPSSSISKWLPTRCAPSWTSSATNWSKKGIMRISHAPWPGASNQMTYCTRGTFRCLTKIYKECQLRTKLGGRHSSPATISTSGSTAIWSVRRLRAGSRDKSRALRARGFTLFSRNFQRNMITPSQFGL